MISTLIQKYCQHILKKGENRYLPISLIKLRPWPFLLRMTSMNSVNSKFGKFEIKMYRRQFQIARDYCTYYNSLYYCT